jgi:hypothetical protein
MIKTRLLAFLLCCALRLPAQDFHLMGSAEAMLNGCIQLTPDEPYMEGLAYSKRKMRLDQYFDIEFDIYLGNKDEGADGIAFVIHTDPRGFGAYGTWGECLGYGRWSKFYEGGTYIAPSIAIEFDTYYNPRQNDPRHDHVAYLENGTTYHEQYWHNNDPNYNLEDGYLHSFRMVWNPESQELLVALDGNVVYRQKKDLINEVFKGATEAIWGFTASTGRAHNLQYFCLKKWAIAP